MSFSVLIAVYKGDNAEFFNQALASIWDIQSTKPGQVVVVQDGKVDPPLSAVIGDWKSKLKELMTLIVINDNVGLGAALNEGLKCCRYDLVARMDSDDIAVPRRFEKQIKFMRENTHIDVSSALVEEYDEKMEVLMSMRSLPADHESIFTFAKRRNPISHPVVIFKKHAVMEVGGYPPFRKSQDYALWSKMLVMGYRMANIQDVLLRMRLGNALQQRRGWSYFKEEVKILRYQRDIGFLSMREFVTNFLIRLCVRVSPTPVKATLYRFVR